MTADTQPRDTTATDEALDGAEPPADPVLHGLLDDIHLVVTGYVALPYEYFAVAVVLWIVVTHVLPAFDCAPRLVVRSPQKRCGKSRLLDVIAGLCHMPLVTIDASTPAIFRSLDCEHPPTLIVDEVDAIFGTKRQAESNEDLRALLNAGHQRDRPVVRCVGPWHIPTEFSVFAMAALAGIGDVPDTITDRAVNITLQRRAPGEKVAQFRSRRDKPVLKMLHDRVAGWAAVHVEGLKDARPKMPVTDRAADTWEPLIAVADAAGSEYGKKARAACKAMVAADEVADQERSLGIRLLTDIRDEFASHGEEFLASELLTLYLRGIEDSPWSEFRLTPRKLAYRLKDYGIKPGHNTGRTVRGYWLKDFSDAFERYLPPDPSKPSHRPETGDDQG
jgi:hypothetical protein